MIILKLNLSLKFHQHAISKNFSNAEHVFYMKTMILPELQFPHFSQN